MTLLDAGIPKLGFGLMRLPRIEGEEIDIPQVCDMVDAFLDAGFTYFDTAWGYPGSEAAAKAALVDRHPRESYIFATKLPAWRTDTIEKAHAMFETSLERTGAGYFDFYLLHNLGGPRTKAFDDWDMWGYVAQKKAEGLVRHIGFSLHDNAAVLDKLLSAHPEIDFVQLQVNWGDWEDPMVQSRWCCEVAEAHGVPIVVMEPAKGGTLSTLPPAVEEILRAVDPSLSPTAWALRFAASVPGVLTVLSGASSIEQMEANIATMKDFERLSDAQWETVLRAGEALRAIPHVSCTSCGYCMPHCPKKIPIKNVLGDLNIGLMYGDYAHAKVNYGLDVMLTAKASDCIACGACERACPQQLDIIEQLKRAAELLE